MIHLNIKIGATGEPPLFPECQPITNGEISGMAILQAGMQSGKTSVSFIIRNANGTYTHAQLSASLFMAAAAAVQGAQRRFGDPS